MEKRTIAAILIIVFVVIGIGGGAYYLFIFAPGLRPGIPNPDTFITQTIGEADTFDPARSYDTASGTIIQSCYETLLWYDGVSVEDTVPRLCESWSVDPTNTIYTFNLRQGITFTDGTPFNASMMKWSIDRAILINDPDSGAWILQQCIKGGADYAWHASWASGNRTEQMEAAVAYLQAGGVKVISEYVLEINIDYYDSGIPTAYPGFEYAIIFSAASAMSPEYVWVHGGKASNEHFDPLFKDVPGYLGVDANYTFCKGVVPGVGNAWMDEHTCGTGPFIATEWTHEVRVVMEKNTNYWGTNDAINDVTADDDYWADYDAKLNRVIIQYVDEYSSRKLAILAGDCDHAYWPTIYSEELYSMTTHSILPEFAGILQVYAEIPTLTAINFEMNMDKDVLATTPAITVKPFSNLNFRKAWQMCFDYDTFITEAMGGHAVRLRNVVPSGMLGYDESIPIYTYDPTTAKTLMATAMTELGISEIEIELFYNAGNDVRKYGCLMLEDNVEGLDEGVTVKVSELDWPTYLAKIRNKELPIFFIGWLPDYPDPDNYIYTYCHESGVYAKRIGYANATITALVEAAAVETDEVARLALYKEIQTEMYRQAFYIFIYQPTTFTVLRTWVSGYYYNNMYSGMPYWSLSKGL